MSQALKKVVTAGLADTGDVARALGVSKRTVQRWMRERNSPHPDKESRLLELAAVMQQAAAALPGQAAEAALWIRSPSGQLDWQVPLDVIRQGNFRHVIATLQTGGAEGEG